MPIGATVQKRPRVLVLGATGRTGGAVARLLDSDDGVTPVRAARKADQVAAWLAEDKSAVSIDLNDPRTFPAALTGIDRLFVMSSYTIEMVHQVKTITDAAADAEVGFIVHLGVYSSGRETDPHFSWHELVERYVQHSGVPWCHLHPNFFMENLLTGQSLVDDRLFWPVGDKRIGWVAGNDLAAVAARVLSEGPAKHAGANYYLSTDLLNGEEAAAVLSETLGRPITCVSMTPDAFTAARASSLPNTRMEAHYAASELEVIRQVYDGRMSHLAATTSIIEQLLGHPATTLATWASLNRALLGPPPSVGNNEPSEKRRRS